MGDSTDNIDKLYKNYEILNDAADKTTVRPRFCFPVKLQFLNAFFSFAARSRIQRNIGCSERFGEGKETGSTVYWEVFQTLP